MARATTTFVPDYASLNAYKAHFSPLSAMLNQVVTRTADTGQVNWATVPTESSGVRDYEVFAMGGSLQATAPMFVRIDYIGGSNGHVDVTVGTTTDGAGNLGGLVATKTALNTAAVSGPYTRWGWAAGDGSYLTFLCNLDVNQTGAEGVGAFVIERVRDATGAPTGAGFHAWRWQRTSTTVTTFQGGWSKTFGAPSQPVNVDYNMGIFLPDAGAVQSSFIGLSSKAFPAYTYTPPFPRGASKALLFSIPADFPRGRTLTVDHYGESMTFLTLNAAVTNPLPYLDSGGTAVTRNLAPMIRWD